MVCWKIAIAHDMQALHLPYSFPHSKLKSLQIANRTHTTPNTDAMLKCRSCILLVEWCARVTAMLRQKLLCVVLPALLLLLLYQICLTSAYLRNARIEEIPFSMSNAASAEQQLQGKLTAQQHGGKAKGIYAITQLEQRRSFFHLFHVPYIVCFFAAKGKWPFVPPFLKVRVDTAAKSFFSQNDSVIKQFCHKWIQIKECFRPIFTPTTPSDVEVVEPARATPCTCSNLVANEPVVYFDKNHIGNVSSEIIHNTIEFLESFLPPPTKKTKKKNHVRGRLDEIDID